MKIPLFKVGEEVILVSAMCPQHNGEYTIEDVYEQGCKPIICKVTGLEVFNPIQQGVVAYSLYPSVVDSEGYEIVWNETAIRKKHKPSGESLQSLIKRLNVKETV